MAVIGLTVGLIAGASGLAVAFFTSTGSGSGGALTGNAPNVSITQIGAGYDSLVATGGYHQDQCFGCAGVSELGNNITLSTPDASQLVNVVVAIDNWGTLVSGTVPITLSINNTVNGAIQDTEYPTLPAAVNSGTPTETDVTFNFSAQGAFVDPAFTYGITFNTTPGAAPVSGSDSLNVALSASATDLSVGQDTNPGTITILGGAPSSNDFPTCMTDLPTATFSSVVTNCGPSNPSNTGAYGDQSPAYDIPAVEVNVVGGVVTGLYPGNPAQPVQYAITNSGTNPVQVDTVSVTLNVSGSDVATPAPASADISGCLSTWYQINGSPQTLSVSGGNIPPGTTLFTTNSAVATTMSIQMLNFPISQDKCEGADVGLNFSSN
jgi:hypothetical protein